MKYRPDYPQRFESLSHARRWARSFFQWYNDEHHHVNLGLLTPAVVHFGQVEAVCLQRQQVLDEASARHPARFAQGRPVTSRPPRTVWINPPVATSDEAASADGAGTAFSSTMSALQQPARTGLTLCPEQEVKTTAVLNGELSQSP